MDDTPSQDVTHRLLAVARQLNASSDLRRILSVIIDAMRDLLGADRATVFEYDAEAAELHTTVGHGVDTAGEPDAGEQIRVALGTGLAGRSAETRAIINVPDTAADPRFNPTFDRKTGYTTRSLLAIPLEDHEGDLVGVAQVLNKRGGPFTRADEEVAAALAAHAAVALKRGRLLADHLVREKLERDLELARRIQRGSLPGHLPRLAGFDLEAWTEPAEQTGGDTFDVVGFTGGRVVDDATPAQRAVLLLADATGHGVGPALSVTQVRSMLRMAVRLGTPLAELVAHMNLQLCQDLPAGRFVTAWLGELDAARATLTSLSAGQGPMLHHRASDDRFVRIDADTVPLGITPALTVEPRPPIALAPGDVFAVISDGMLEARDANDEQFGTDRAERAIRAARSGSAAEIAAALRGAVARFAGGRPPDDDRTVVVVKRDDEDAHEG